MIIVTPEKEAEFRNRATYKLTPQINPIELDIIKKNGSFNLLVNAYVLGMCDVYVELMEEITKLKLQIPEIIIDSSINEEKEQIIVPLYPNGAPPMPILND